MEKLFIDGHRSGYTPEQCGETMTIKELIDALENIKEWYGLDDESPVYLVNDNGYTFGHFDAFRSFHVGETWDDEYRVDAL